MASLKMDQNKIRASRRRLSESAIKSWKINSIGAYSSLFFLGYVAPVMFYDIPWIRQHAYLFGIILLCLPLKNYFAFLKTPTVWRHYKNAVPWFLLPLLLTFGWMSFFIWNERYLSMVALLIIAIVFLVVMLKSQSRNWDNYVKDRLIKEKIMDLDKGYFDETDSSIKDCYRADENFQYTPLQRALINKGFYIAGPLGIFAIHLNLSDSFLINVLWPIFCYGGTLFFLFGIPSFYGLYTFITNWEKETGRTMYLAGFEPEEEPSKETPLPDADKIIKKLEKKAKVI